MSDRADRLKKLQEECSLFRTLTDSILIEKTLLFDYGEDFGITNSSKDDGYIFVYQFEGKIDYFFSHYCSEREALVLNDPNEAALSSNEIRVYMNDCICRIKNRNFASFEDLKQEVLLFYALAQALACRERITKCIEMQELLNVLAQAWTKNDCLVEYDLVEMHSLLHWAFMTICSDDLTMKLLKEFDNLHRILNTASEGRTGILESLLEGAHDVKMMPKQKNYEITIKGFDETTFYYAQMANERHYSKDENHKERVATSEILGTVIYLIREMEENASFFTAETLSRFLPFFAVQVALLRVRVTGEEAKAEALKLYNRGLKALEGEGFKSLGRDMNKVVKIMRDETQKLQCDGVVSCVNLLGASLEMHLEEERFDIKGTLASMKDSSDLNLADIDFDVEKESAEILAMGEEIEKMLARNQLSDAKFEAENAELDRQLDSSRQQYKMLTESFQKETERMNAEIAELERQNQQNREELN